MMSEINKPFNEKVHERRHSKMEVKDKKTAYAFLGIVHSESQRLNIPVKTAIVEEETITHGHKYGFTAHFMTYTQNEHSDLLLRVAAEWNETVNPDGPNNKYYRDVKKSYAELGQEF